MRLGDWILCISITLNLCAMLAYGYEGHYKQAGYWFAALQINFWLMGMK